MVEWIDGAEKDNYFAFVSENVIFHIKRSPYETFWECAVYLGGKENSASAQTMRPQARWAAKKWCITEARRILTEALEKLDG